MEEWDKNNIFLLTKNSILRKYAISPLFNLVTNKKND